MYNTTSKRLNYKQLDPIDAQAAKKGRSRGSLAAEQHEGQSLDTQLPISEARDARAIVEWEKGSRGSRRRRPATAVVLVPTRMLIIEATHNWACTEYTHFLFILSICTSIQENTTLKCKNRLLS